VAISKADEAALAAKFAGMRQVLNERQWRVYLGSEANALGYGGIAAVARAAGVSETTVAAGAAEIRDPEALAALESARSRRPGAGRPRAEKKQPGLGQELDGLLEEGRRGDPVSEVTWSILSLRDIARQLTLRGFPVGKDTVARLMRERGYSLQGMSRVLEGRQHEDRDLQFGNIGAETAVAIEEGQPVLSADGKKKELLGAYHRAGRSWRRAGDPVQVRTHDFPDRDGTVITPYGIYDIAANRGFAVVGTSCDTAAFAVNAIGLWWREQGQFRYPAATRLLITCDAGGSNSHRSRLWKDQLAVLAGQTGLRIEVMHFPPGTSKWNKIEHRLFCHLSRTWKARPLMSVDDAVAGIAATVTGQGLKCAAVRDDAVYPRGVKVPEDRMTCLKDRIIEPSAFHGEWNYALLPAPRPAPDPEPAPAPGRPQRVPQHALNHPALTGLPAAGLTALAARLEAQFEARLQLHYRTRHGTRTRARHSQAPHASRRLDVTDYLLALRLRHLRLPAAAVAVLLGIGPGTVPHVTALAEELLHGARITLPPSQPPAQLPRSPAELPARTAAAGNPLTLPGNGQTMPQRFRTRTNKPATDTPGTAN
jgi:DDE family transposase